MDSKLSIVSHLKTKEKRIFFCLSFNGALSAISDCRESSSFSQSSVRVIRLISISFYARLSYCIAWIQCLKKSFSPSKTKKKKNNFLSTFTTMDGCIIFSNNIVILWVSTTRKILPVFSYKERQMTRIFSLRLCSPSCLLPMTGRHLSYQITSNAYIYRHHHYPSSYYFSLSRLEQVHKTIFKKERKKNIIFIAIE
jgi:hypothetical protein